MRIEEQTAQGRRPRGSSLRTTLTGLSWLSAIRAQTGAEQSLGSPMDTTAVRRRWLRRSTQGKPESIATRLRGRNADGTAPAETIAGTYAPEQATESLFDGQPEWEDHDMKGPSRIPYTPRFGRRPTETTAKGGMH